MGVGPGSPLLLTSFLDHLSDGRVVMNLNTGGRGQLEGVEREDSGGHRRGTEAGPGRRCMVTSLPLLSSSRTRHGSPRGTSKTVGRKKDGRFSSVTDKK